MAEIQRYLRHGTLYSSPPQPEPRFLYEHSNSVAVLPDNPMEHTLLVSVFTRCQSASTDIRIESLQTTEPHVTAAVPTTTGSDDG
jgi:hypothetical protein